MSQVRFDPGVTDLDVMLLVWRDRNGRRQVIVEMREQLVRRCRQGYAEYRGDDEVYIAEADTFEFPLASPEPDPSMTDDERDQWLETVLAEWEHERDCAFWDWLGTNSGILFTFSRDTEQVECLVPLAEAEPWQLDIAQLHGKLDDWILD